MDQSLFNRNVQSLRMKGYSQQIFAGSGFLMRKTFPAINGNDFKIEIFLNHCGKNSCDIYLGNIWLGNENGQSIETDVDVPIEQLLESAKKLVQSHAENLIKAFMLGSMFRNLDSHNSKEE